MEYKLEAEADHILLIVNFPRKYVIKEDNLRKI